VSEIPPVDGLTMRLQIGLRKAFGPVAQLVKAHKRIQALELELDHLRCKLDLPDELVQRFQAARKTTEYQAHYTKPKSLVTVCVSTYNRSELLIERSVKSILKQTHQNIQLIVVGDHCTDDTEARLGKIKDSRLHFVNLPERGHYPEDAFLRWMVAGTAPVNAALSMAEGEFITHLDDDDLYESTRVAELLTFLQANKADLVWHPFWMQKPNYNWWLVEAKAFEKGAVTTSSVMYHSWLKTIPWDPLAYTYREPGDWNRFRKIRYLGASVQRYPKPLLYHFRERSQTK
jgi:glycosyltransferase involved in cell wall biosynthesis